MTPQEPGAWELQRRLDQIDSNQKAGFDRLDKRLDRLVTNDAFHAEQRRVDEKHRDLADDIAAEREARKAENVAEKREREKGDAQQQAALDKLIGNQKWLVVAVLLPIGLFLANLYFSRGAS